MIIVDDGSQDGSKEIIDNFRNTQNIKVITKSEHKGIPHTMNLAVENAQYEHIIFCDQRQDLCRNILQRLVDPLNSAILVRFQPVFQISTSIIIAPGSGSLKISLNQKKAKPVTWSASMVRFTL